MKPFSDLVDGDEGSVSAVGLRVLVPLVNQGKVVGNNTEAEVTEVIPKTTESNCKPE